MNSEKLKKSHEKVYKEFFVKNSLVFSLPFVFNWTSGGDYFESSSMKQKAPFRMYIWINYHGKEKVNLGKLISYDFDLSQFKSSKIKQWIKRHQKITNFFYEHVKGLDKNITISVLSELESLIWLDFERILSLLVATVKSRFEQGSFDKKILKNQNDKIQSLWGSLVEKIIEDSKKISFELNNKPCSLIEITSIVNSNYPLLTINTDKTITVRQQFEKTIRASEIYDDIKEVPFASVDYMLVYSWSPQIDCEKNNWTEYLIKKEKTDKLFKALEKKIKIKKQDYDYDRDTYIKKAENFSEIVNNNAICAVIEFFRFPNDEENIAKNISICWKSRFVMYIASNFWRKFTTATNVFIRKYFQEYGNLWIIGHTRNCVWWCFLVVVELNRSRSNLNERLEKVKELFPSACCLFRSREDEYDERGLVIEHDIENGIISDMLDPNLHIYSRPDGSYITGSFHGILENPEVDVAFDIGDGKIYVNGEKTTSKEILSQTAIVELMAYMIENKKRTIMNTDLPRSSFTRNKNTLNAKIINPLKKLIRQKSWKELYLSSSGSLTQFEISLSPSDVSIGIMKRVRPPKY